MNTKDTEVLGRELN